MSLKDRGLGLSIWESEDQEIVVFYDAAGKEFVLEIDCPDCYASPRVRCTLAELGQMVESMLKRINKRDQQEVPE